MTFTSPLISADLFAALQRARWNTVSDSSLPIYASITLHGRLQRDTIFPSPPSSSIDTQNFKFLKFQFSKGANLYAYMHSQLERKRQRTKGGFYSYLYDTAGSFGRRTSTSKTT
jgi:hypothetical protein